MMMMMMLPVVCKESRLPLLWEGECDDKESLLLQLCE
jgi:hypothetical protein